MESPERLALLLGSPGFPTAGGLGAGTVFFAELGTVVGKGCACARACGVCVFLSGVHVCA